MATEVENNAPPAESKEIKEETPAADAKAEEAAKQEAGDAPKDKEPAPPKVLVHKTNYEKDVVYLYQFSRTPLLPSLSPFCLKVESWLRLAGIKYEVSTDRRHFDYLTQNFTKMAELNTFLHKEIIIDVSRHKRYRYNTLR